MQKVLITKKAEEDLRALLTYTNQYSESGMRHLHKDFRKALLVIGEFPEAGRLFAGYRFIPFGPKRHASIYHVIKDGQSIIARVLHTFRDVEGILKKNSM